MNTSRTYSARNRLTAWVLALALALVELGLLVHQVEHQLHGADATCTLCIAAGHIGSAPPNTPATLTPELHTLPLYASVAVTVHARPVNGFCARAPPLSA